MLFKIYILTFRKQVLHKMYIYYDSISDTVTDNGVFRKLECSHYFCISAGDASGVLITECTFCKDTNMIPK